MTTKEIEQALEDKIFNAHYNYYKGVGIETIKQQSGQIEQVSSDYQGRVIFELLQNAFDKANKNILVKVIGKSLFVANDGEKFTFNIDYDYNTGNYVRGDFQSLCSISTSTKIGTGTIGNKGVGFKSVYSIAKYGYANVYTKAKTIQANREVAEPEDPISFRIYDSFKDPDKIPMEFNEDIRLSIKQKIEFIKKERKDRGVPGYYFPLHITDENTTILDFFNKGFITIIEIPFDKIENITPLFEEIQKIHFQFIKIKYPRDFKLSFICNGISFEKGVINNSPNYFTIPIKKNKIEQFAKEANIPIDISPKVALFFKDDPDGLLYNYLPTKESSPFRYVDFHADFQTTVDRKSIEFDRNTTIGKYNYALLQACIELYFAVLNTFLSTNNQISFHFEFINQDNFQHNFDNFQWNFLELGKADSIFWIVRNILKIKNINIYDYTYSLASELLTNLADERFKIKRNEKEHTQFFGTIKEFITYFSRWPGQDYKWINLFKKEFAKQILNKGTQIIPDATLNKNKELLYKEKEENTIRLPSSLGVNITTFDIGDDFLKERLGIKKYSDINVLFKYFRQVGIDGSVSISTLSEDQQINFLKALFELFKTKKDKKIDSFANRYKGFLNEHDRKNLSSLNIANFSVSTVWLKTINSKKYKPAQLCNLNELDEFFIEKITEGEAKEDFLKFIGVSSEKDYLIVDKLVHDKFKDGINHIPDFYPNDETTNLTANRIIPNIKVITNKGEVHPALINYNRYSFLNDISNRKMQKHLEALKVGNYDGFPLEYVNILFEKVQKNTLNFPKDVFRLYSANTFKIFNEIGQYLIINKTKMSWTKETNFKIAQNKQDFDLLKEQDINLLCFYNGNEIPEILKEKIINLTLSEITIKNEKDITKQFKDEYKDYIPYILADISYLNSNISEKDYIKNISDISKFQSFWNSLIIKEGDCLMANLSFDNEMAPIQTEHAYLFDKNILYFNKTISKSQKAAAIAKSIFNINSLDSKIELMFFHKKVEDLDKEYDKNDIILIKNKWLPDYDKKFHHFINEILSNFTELLKENEINKNWYIYNENVRSDFLILIEKERKLKYLEHVIRNIQNKEIYNEYFADFQLEIDISHIERRAGEIISLLEKIQPKPVHKINEVQNLSKHLGTEERLEESYSEILQQNPSLKENVIDESELAVKSKEIKIRNKTDEIFDKMNFLNLKQETTLNFSGNISKKLIPVNGKKLIFQGDKINTKSLEIIGATGEEEILIYFINEFIKLDKKERKKGIEEVYTLLKKKVNDTTYENYKTKCLNVLSNDVQLKKALIPFFYVTLHYKYSYFDLIVYHNKKPTLVEVKTSNRRKNNKFYLSIAEVNTARSEDNYLIVINNPESIIFIGNPIKEIEDNISYIEGNTFSLIPRNYEFIYNNN